MSCLIVEHATIDCLVQAMVGEQVCATNNATMVGRVLWRQNIHAFQASHPHVDVADDLGRMRQYQYRPFHGALNPDVVLQQADYYQHQASGDPRFERSPARRLVVELARQLRERGAVARGPWGIDTLTDAALDVTNPPADR